MLLPTEDPRHVWRDMTQAQLDWAYDQTQHANNMAEVMAECAELSAQARAQLQDRGIEVKRLAYGPTTIEALDWYPSLAPNAPLVFFVHGGAWRRGQAQDYAMAAAWLNELGVHLVVPDFSAVTDVQGSLLTMVDQLQRALTFTVRTAANLGADAQQIYVVGHSSGAHLAACLGAFDWHQHGIAPQPINALMCCSGMYELEPVSLSARSQYVSFNPKTLQALSPQRHLHRFNMPIALLCGEQESPEFKRQALEFAKSLSVNNAQLELIWGQGLNHFEMLQSFASPDGFMSQVLIKLMQRSATSDSGMH
jgi:arylformamidase